MLGCLVAAYGANQDDNDSNQANYASARHTDLEDQQSA
jgi:hypothetical protein